MTPTVPAELVARAARLADEGTGGRAMIGITGPPGAGKSTLAAGLVAALDGRAALVPMDGYHLDDAVLEALGRRQRKGAPDTFDAEGYVSLLRRLRARDDDVVYAPEFRRHLELAVAGAIAVPRDVPLVITEGNYLLHGGPFAPVRDLLTETWFVDEDASVRQSRLVDRHVSHGRTPQAARDWVASTDGPNAVLVERTRAAADLIVRGGS